MEVEVELPVNSPTARDPTTLYDRFVSSPRVRAGPSAAASDSITPASAARSASSVRAGRSGTPSLHAWSIFFLGFMAGVAAAPAPAIQSFAGALRCQQPRWPAASSPSRGSCLEENRGLGACFNTGVWAVRPNNEAYGSLVRFLAGGSYPCGNGDQAAAHWFAWDRACERWAGADCVNATWRGLPHTYNLKYVCLGGRHWSGALPETAQYMGDGGVVRRAKFSACAAPTTRSTSRGPPQLRSRAAAAPVLRDRGAEFRNYFTGVGLARAP